MAFLSHKRHSFSEAQAAAEELDRQLLEIANGERKVGKLSLEQLAIVLSFIQGMPAAWRDALAERERQVNVEGWTPEHDDEHSGMELAFAASCYCVADEGEAPCAVWPWDWKWWKPKDHRSNLVKAGALILAELERLDRAV